MSERILVTGSAGLIGRSLCRALRAIHFEVVELDLRARRAADRGDVRDPTRVERALIGCTGVVHLAAIARVELSECDPAECERTNIQATELVLRSAQRVGAWMLFASSREVYGASSRLPVPESAPLAPLNTYGRSKAAAEAIIEAARTQHGRVAIVRLANVYGSIDDHAQRVIPAFVRRAVLQQPLVVEGATRTLDFTHLDDVAHGLLAVIDELRCGDAPPPVQLVSGQPTTLGSLGRLVIELAASKSVIELATPRTHAVPGFVGDPTYARTRLRWAPRVSLHKGITRMIEDTLSQNRQIKEVAS